MKGDAQSYGRATMVAVLGFALQIAAAAGMGIYAGLSKGDHAATTAAIHIAVGVFVWLPLIFLFDLHRRERREVVELERLAQDEAAGVFETSEQPRAARTLDAVRKYVLPALTLLIGGSLLAIGLSRFRAMSAMDSGAMDGVELLNQGFGISIGLALAIAGFVFARFVSGMATQRIWAPLRAGASYAVGSALLGLTIAVARFIDTSFGRPVAMDAVAHAVPIFTLVLGGEMLLNFVLDIYRPRKPGEDPRPGFDSRLLGLLAAPDKIAENIGEALNYQFGVEVSKSWFYQLIQRWWPGLVAVALLVAWGMTSLVVIEPHQRAMVLTFGSPSPPLFSFGSHDAETDEIGPGLHIVAPWPMTEVYVPVSSIDANAGDEVRTSTGVRVLQLGTNPPKANEAILWTNEHTVREVYSLVQPAPIGLRGGEANSGDVSMSLVAVEIPVQYVIEDVRAFDTLAQPDHRDLLLDVLGERMLMRLMAPKNMAEILGAGRTELGREVGDALVEAFATIPDGSGEPSEAGIRVLHVGAAGAHPPQKAAVYFERVVQEQQLREAKVEAAREFEARVLNLVAAPIERPDGTVVDAAMIVEMINDLSARAWEGERGRAMIEQELTIQRLLEEMGGAAGSSLIAAGAERWVTHMGERGKAALYQGQLASFRAAPALYMTSRYFDALLEMMRDSRVFLTGEKIERLNVVIDGHSRESNLDLFDPDVGSEYQP